MARGLEYPHRIDLRRTQTPSTDFVTNAMSAIHEFVSLFVEDFFHHNPLKCLFFIQNCLRVGLTVLGKRGAGKKGADGS